MAKRTSYRIGDVCRLLDLQPYVLRYWETEFPVLQPAAGAAGGQRTYEEREVEVVRRIKALLYEEGYTIAGAKKKLESELASGRMPGEVSPSLFTEEEVGESAVPPRLDSAGTERIERLRQGLREALGEARQLQRLLRRSPGEPLQDD